MGYMRHHMIVVTSYSNAHIKQAHDKAIEIFGTTVGVTPVIVTPVNAYHTFFVPPDGSKEWWDPSDEGDSNRAKFVEWLDKQRYSDGSSPLSWAEVQYGDDERDNRMLRHDGEVEPCDPDLAPANLWCLT